jgi:hypothetical protein
MNQTIQDINELRGKIQVNAEAVNFLKNVVSEQLTNQPHLLTIDQRDELLANITLAYRHIEDAKMRLGKAIQAITGFSPYDTPAAK